MAQLSEILEECPLIGVALNKQLAEHISEIFKGVFEFIFECKENNQIIFEKIVEAKENNEDF